MEQASLPDVTDLPSQLPFHFRLRLQFILPYHPRYPSTAGLYYAKRTANDRLILTTPVIPKPWEWIEYTGASSAPTDNPSDGHAYPPGGGRSMAASDVEAGLVRNTAALSLEHFGAVSTGERVYGEAERSSNRIHAELRNSSDHFHGETIYERHWRGSRLAWIDPADNGKGPPSVRHLESLLTREDSSTYSPAHELPLTSPAILTSSDIFSDMATPAHLTNSSETVPMDVDEHAKRAPPTPSHLSDQRQSTSRDGSNPLATRGAKRKASSSSSDRGTGRMPSGLIVEVVMPPSANTVIKEKRAAAAAAKSGSTSTSKGRKGKAKGRE